MADASVPEVDGRKKGGFLKKLIRTVLMIAILGGGGFGAGMYYSGGALAPSQEVLRLIELDEAKAAAEAEAEGGPKKVPKDKPETPTFKTSYYEFPDDLTTNLKDSRRFLQLGVGVSTQYDAEVIANIEAHAMALRSDMLAVISSFREEEVDGTAGRDKLSAALKEAINKRLESLEGFGGIEGVFFPTFILQ